MQLKQKEIIKQKRKENKPPKVCETFGGLFHCDYIISFVYRHYIICKKYLQYTKMSKISHFDIRRFLRVCLYFVLYLLYTLTLYRTGGVHEEKIHKLLSKNYICNLLQKHKNNLL